MGLAACQSRYLSITARKTNVEYEALQINQQRTSLATKTSNIYNKLCSLQQPVQPSPSDYYKTDYTYSVSSGDQAGNYTIDSYVKNTGSDTYTIYATREFDTQTASKVTSSEVESVEADGESYKITFKDGTVKTYSKTTDSQSIINIINEALGTQAIPDGEQLYQYTDADTGNVHYLTQTELDELISGEEKTYDDYSVYMTKKTEKVTIPDATIIFDSTGKMSKITTDDYSNIEVNSTTVLDEEAYEKAKKEYQSKQTAYDNEVKELQNETNKIQQQDKTLELKLDQLDTEQQTLKTELESVTKMLDENVKKIFNTFSSSG